MRVCYFGNYKKAYSRNQILIKGLKLNKVDVIECNSRKTGLLKYIDLFIQHNKIRNNYDVMIIGFPGYQSVFLARLISNKKPRFFTLQFVSNSV